MNAVSGAEPAAAGVDGQRRDQLLNALIDEGCTLQELGTILERQRRGVAENDQDLIEASVQALGRTLLTMEEARRRRESLLALLAGGEPLRLRELERVFGDPLPVALADARRSVQQLATTIARELAINHHIIDRALQAGDQFLQRLFSESLEPAASYCPEGETDPTAGVLVNRTA